MVPPGAIAALSEENRMSQQFNVAVLGASGAVGQAMIGDPGRARISGSDPLSAGFQPQRR